MSIRIIDQPVSRADLAEIAKERFGDMVKAVVDLDRGIMAIGGELHADEEAVLLEQGSKQEDLWGINLYPGAKDDSFLEYDSMINIRPSQEQIAGVEDAAVREKVRDRGSGSCGDSMTYQHQEMAAGRWQALTFAEQMGNIRSEVSRAVKAKNDETRYWPAGAGVRAA